ncbi:hypothetical protein C4K88_06595 [Arthrobacter pityocampae]|uniref:Transposase IS116/IS110/IS902 C-terminal domain-containing protein n=1 Tax=Arthrobacter pityocampae TaxID=547334 RepID=A0A2S5IXR6_9MICC|nr:hypothetical protein C4K88_06595 [Arthrobacter pityocampae]
MPGIGVRTCARILTEVTGKHFASSAHLASYAGIISVTRRSGTSVRGEHPSRRGNEKLKRALFLSAFAALRHPPLRTYYYRKRTEDKRHNQALVALARRRSDVVFAMLHDGNLNQDPTHKQPDLSWLTKTIEAPPDQRGDRRASGQSHVHVSVRRRRVRRPRSRH